MDSTTRHHNKLLENADLNCAAQTASNYGKYLYHYTSIGALQGILENKELWLSNLSQVNDRNEIIEFTNAICSTLDQKYAKENPIKNKLVSEIQTMVKNSYPYSASFSKHCDDAAQWERYGDNAKGYCIGFRTDQLKLLATKKSLCLNPVYYEFETQNHEGFEMACELIDNGKDDEANIKKLGELIVATAGNYKHKSFQSENEVRLYCLKGLEHYANSKGVQYVQINGCIKPVLEIPLSFEMSPGIVGVDDIISGIIIGPRSSQKKEDLEKYVESLGYTKLPSCIVYSQCPLR